eukprot:gene9566-10555_t
MAAAWKGLSILCSLLQLVVLSISATNLALHRNIDANVTCGSPPELFYESSQGDKPVSERVASTCNASSAINSHPPSYLLDGSNYTFWQTKAGVDVAYITIDLRSIAQKFIFVRKIHIFFGDYRRPAQIAYSKSSDGGLTFQPWHYYVAFASQCQSVFGATFRTRPFTSNTILCTNYANFLPLESNETISVDLHGGRASTNTLSLQQWMNATHIRIRFSGLFRKFDLFSVKWHHYSVRGISVTGDCFCNGHASVCNVNSTTGNRICQCENNACGLQCDQCCPAFNQYAFKQGSKAPFEVDPNAACQPCNCHNHSSVCIFNQTIADMRGSLNATGFYSGGGVCQNCQHKTTGVNCEKCVTFYYRPNGISRQLVDVCTECNCSRLGTRNETGVAYLDCVRDETLNISGMGAGDCYCKSNVFQRQCDACRPGFYNLTADNSLGCQNCNCFLPGTLNGSNVCTPDARGICPCKANTEQRACNVCRDEFFNLTASNSNGCENCSCDSGGRTSKICNKITGNCECKSVNITGRQCDRPKDGFYYPNLHYINFALTRSTGLPSAFSGQVRVPSFTNSSGLYYVIIKYSSTVTATDTFTMQGVGTGILAIRSNCAPPQQCYGYISGSGFALTPGTTYNVYNNVVPGNVADASKVSLTSVVLLPSEFYSANILEAALRSEFMANCDVLSNNMTRTVGIFNPTCLAGVYSMTMGLLGTPIDCACNLIGSVNGVCEKYDGQCLCKPGVTGKQCDKCLPAFYNFTSNGCSPCNCSTDNKICNQTTGQCVCPPHTIGRTCNACENLHWAWNSNTGCQACGCNATGSTNMQCDLQRGNCSCKYGIGNANCSECLDTYTGFSTSGCSSCNCSLNGSQSDTCQKQTNQCPCKANTIGKTCDTCSSTSFYLSALHQTGCLECVCMGITSNCSSSQDYVYKEPLPAHLWKLGHETALLGINSMNSTIGSGTQIIPAVLSTMPTHNQPIYWAAPVEFTQKSWVGAYGGVLEFSLLYGTSAGSVQNSQFIIMKGKGITVYHNLTKTSPNIINVRRIQMTETSWKYSNGSSISRSLFLLVLAKPEALLITASSYNTSSSSYTSRLGGLSMANVQSSLTSSGRALQVEQCQCGTGYTGSSCERCASGYKRSRAATHAYLGVCVPCECNGHSDQCDPDTGRCLNCLHNTTGDSCQLCLPTFFGNATSGTSSDCQRCPCSAPRTTTALCTLNTDGSVQCSNCSNGYEGPTCDSCSVGYFGQPLISGGLCQLCQCTNNSDVCNTTTGECQTCQFNTTGAHCERCRDGWYGNAVAKSCKSCSCDEIGSASTICNHTNGECSCKPNVVGMNCTSCAVNSYGFNNVTGCLTCGCNQFGSLQMQCNETGMCSCLNNTVNAKCDRCEAGYFGLPARTCELCNCNSTGSYNGSCSILSGQCFCKPGVGGRECTQCLKQHINFNSSGCTACQPCTQLLQRKIDTQTSISQQTYTNLQTVRDMANLSSRLQATEQRLSAVQLSRQQFDNRIRTLQQGVNRIKSDALAQSINGLVNRTNAMKARSTAALATSNVEKLKFERIQLESEQAAQNVIALNSSVDAIIANLENIKSDSQRLYDSSLGLDFTFKHETELSYAQGNATDAVLLLSRMQNITSTLLAEDAKINETQSNVTDLQNILANQEVNFANLKGDFELQQQRLAYVQDNITAIQNTFETVSVVLQNTSLLLNLTQQSNTNTSQSLTQSRAALTSANETLYNETGVVNMLRVLSANVDELRKNITKAEAVVQSAISHAANLSRSVTNMTNVFQPAKSHGSNAVNAVKRYEEISRLINQSMELSKQANASIQDVNRYFETPGNQNTTLKAQTSLDESRKLYSVSLSQQNAYAGLQGNLSQANSTFLAVDAIGQQVSTKYDTFLTSLNQLVVAWENGIRPHSMETAISSANNISANVTQTANDVVKRSQELDGNMASLNTAIVNVNNTVLNSTKILGEAWRITNNITQKLANTSDSPMAHVNSMTGLIQQFNTTSKPLIENRLSSIQAKLDSLKQRIARLQASMKLNGSNSVTYRPTSSVLLQSSYSEIQMDFKTTQRNAFLMFFGNESSSSANELSLKVVSSRVVFEYVINGRVRRLTNWEVGVSDGNWRRVYATRQGDFSRLTVSMLSTNFSRTYSLYESGNRLTTMAYPIGSHLFIGGLSPSNMINSTVSNFRGCVNNLKLNKMQISIWNYTAATNKPVYCNSSNLATPLISGASFFGNSFVKMNMGNFSVRNYSRIEFQFRTFQKNATLFAVQSVSNQIIFSISLVEGKIHFLVTTPFSLSRTRLDTYADGNIYKVVASRSTNHVSLIVTSVVNGTTKEEPLQLQSQMSLLDEGTAMYFGGVNASFGGQLHTAYNLAGCIMNVSLSNKITQKNDAIKLNDASLLQYSNGVIFDGCLSQIINGLRFIGNGYSTTTTSSARLTSLDIVFKTNEPSGVLFYAENKGVKFYIALTHGNVFLDYKNATKNVRTILETRTQTLNDGKFHTIRVTLMNSLMVLTVNGMSQSVQLQSGLAPSVELNGRLYVGGVASSMQNSLYEFPVLASFQGGIQTIKVNEIDIMKDLIIGGSQVSLAGISPVAENIYPTSIPTNPPPTTAPPSCAAASGPPQTSGTAGVGFNFNSTLGLTAKRGNPSDVLGYFQTNQVLTIEFRAISQFGVIFYGTSPSSPGTFISLELINGQLLYQFNSGDGLVQVRTDGTFSHGTWTKVFLMRMSQFGAMLISQTREYKNNMTGTGTRTMELKFPLYIGGTPENVGLSTIQNPRGKDSFIGSVRSFQVQGTTQTYTFDLSTDRDLNVTKNIRQGYASVVPIVRLTGSGYFISAQNLQSTNPFSISIKFRTTTKNGILWHLYASSSQPQLLLEQRFGQIVLTLTNNAVSNSMSWTDPQLPANKPANSSFSICDNTFHTVTISRNTSSTSYIMTVNSTSAITASIGSETVTGSLYVGGSPHVSRNGVAGCIQSLIINGRQQDLASQASQRSSVSVFIGCAP